MVEPSAPARRGWLVPALLGALVVAVLAVAGVLLFNRTGGGGASPATKPSGRVVQGIAAPDSTCVSSPTRAQEDAWQVNGWWAGYVDGAPKELQAGAALSAKIAGHTVSRVWLCPAQQQWKR